MARIPTLDEIKQTYQQKAQSLAPVKTGTMRDSIRVSYKKLKDFSYSFDLNGVAYMIWWNAPTISRTVRAAKTGNVDKINFVYTAANSPEVRNIINEYTVKAVVEAEVLGKMRDYLEKDGYGKVKQVFRAR